MVLDTAEETLYLPRKTLRQDIEKVKSDILELETKLYKKSKKLKELYSQCDHTLRVKIRGYEEDVLECLNCGYETYSEKRST